jgi:hypothetical protein
MPREDIPSMLQMVEEKITSSEIEVHQRHTLIRLRHFLEEDLQAAQGHPLPPEVDGQLRSTTPKVRSSPSCSSLDN